MVETESDPADGLAHSVHAVEIHAEPLAVPDHLGIEPSVAPTRGIGDVGLVHDGIGAKTGQGIFHHAGSLQLPVQVQQHR